VVVMDITQTLKVGLMIVITLLSGLGDSQGFVHASKIWKNGNIIITELMFSAIGFGFGILFYWMTLRFLEEFGIVSSEIQALGWFTVTIVGVAIINRNFFDWSLAEQLVGLALLVGIGWLIVRKGG
jgi:hypothetical protein